MRERVAYRDAFKKKGFKAILAWNGRVLIWFEAAVSGQRTCIYIEILHLREYSTT